VMVLCRTGYVPESEHIETRISNTSGGRNRHEDCPGDEPERYKYLEHQAHEAHEKVGIRAVDVQDGNFRFTPYEAKPADYMCG